MAHEALISLNLMIESYLNIPKYINIFLPIQETKSVHKKVWSLKSILELDHFEESERLNALKGDIEEVIPKFKDLLQDHINKCLLLFSESQSLYGGGSSTELIFSQDLEKVKEEMISLVEQMKRINNEYHAVDDLKKLSNKVSPLADPVEALIIETESFLNTPYFNNFHLIRETNVLGIMVRHLNNVLKRDHIHFKESKRLNDLKGEIVEEILTTRHVLQDYINKCQVLFSESQSLHDESSPALIFFQDLEEVRKEMIFFVETMKKIKEEYDIKSDMETSDKESPPADEDFGGNEALHIRGLIDEGLHQLINRVKIEPFKFEIISVEGMAGIGKTTIVKALYNEPDISDYFDIRAFVRVGRNYHLKDILLDLLVCLFPNYNKMVGIEKSDYALKYQLYEYLEDKRCLIVLDDVWDTLHYDIASFIQNNGSKLIITTRRSGLGADDVHKIPFLNKEQSWNLFCRKVVVPLGFEKVGKKIVKKCDGLPLGIISIANSLSTAEKTLDYWEKVAKDENLFALAIKEGSHMSESLFFSYKHLPPYLKECCLYFGVFPLNHEISASKLVKLWVGEGLVEAKHNQTFEDTARKYLEGLISHNIVLVRQQSSSGRTKTCYAHYFFWHLFVREAANKKIFRLINSDPSAFLEGINCQRRLCIHRNALLGFKRVSESIESVSNVRSFLCTGPEHQYPVSICSGLTALKVLDVLTIRLYKFTMEILDLVELKYLAFTNDGKLPSSISRLKNLVYLIVHRYHQTIIDFLPSYMPIEIWNMQELRHLQVMGSDLPHPVDGAKLPKLLTLLGVSDRSCTKEVLQSIPNLEKLGVQIVLSRGVSKTLRIFDHLALLSKLKSFKCIVSNPNQQVLLLSKSVFPSSLTKLTLSGCRCAWEDMSMIGALINLRVLKLLCYAFQGPEWVVDRQEFPKLEYLLLEDTDLVHLKIGYGFPQLNRLIIKHCYKLEEISYELEYFIREAMDLVDCSWASAKHILEQRERGKHKFPLRVSSSLNNEKQH